MSTETNTEVNTEQAVLPTAPELPAVTAKMSNTEILELVNKYMKSCEASLAQLQRNMTELAEQQTKLQQMSLMVAGQRELVKDLFAKIVGTEQKSQ